MIRCALLALGLLALSAMTARGGEWTGSVVELQTQGAMRAWFVLPARMVPEDADLPFSALPAKATLHCARNETDCVQLVILQLGRLDNCAVEFSEFTSQDKHALPMNVWRANKLGSLPGVIASRAASTIASWSQPSVDQPNLPATTPTPSEYSASAARSVPDVLMPEEPFAIDTGYTRIWLTLKVPKDQPPGLYAGNVRIRRGDDTVFTTPLRVRVWNHTLPDEPSIMVLADVRGDQQPLLGEDGKPSWDRLKPYFDDLKAHRINATGEIFPLPAWRKDEPPPEMTQYEAALKYVLDELGFKRFRFANGGAIAEQWDGVQVFDDPPIVDDLIWLAGGTFVKSEPPMVSTTAPSTESTTARWRRGANRSAARLEGSPGNAIPWVEYEFDNTIEEPLSVWVQVDAQQPDERKVVSIDGHDVGVLTGEQSMTSSLGFVRLEQTVVLAPGKHTLRIGLDTVVGSSDAIESIALTSDPQADIARLLRRRALLSSNFRAQFGYHVRQTSQWLRERGWMKKAHLDMHPDDTRGDCGQLAALYDFAGELLPSARRELAQPPSVMLRKSVEVWTPVLASQSFAPDEWIEFKEAGDEVWARHELLHTLGYPSIAMRMIPWVLARHQFDGYVLPCVNDPAAGPMRTTLIHCDATTGAPLDSVRWELLREGLEDYETLRMLRTAIDESAVTPSLDPKLKITIQDAQLLLEKDVPAMIRSARDFSWDAAALESIRIRAGDMLSQLTTSQESPR